MTRRRAAACLAIALVALATAPLAAQTTSPRRPPLAGRAFRVEAEAFPFEPAPGRNQTSLGARGMSTRARAANPPIAANARATTTDLGITEAYTGPVGPSAETDSSVENFPEDAEVRSGPNVLKAHSDRSPRSRADATGSDASSPGATFGSFAASSAADGSKETLLATAEAEVNDAVFGALVIGSARYRARARTTGRPGGAAAEGVVEASDATVNGVPVVIDNTGVRVDDDKVPVEQVAVATDAVRQALSQGGYSEVRVVQPAVEVARDGSRAVVSGGGVFVYLTNNNPAEKYFFRFNLVGGGAAVFVGAELGGRAATAATPTRPGLPAAGSTTAATAVDSGAMVGTTPRGAPTAAPTAAPGETDLDLARTVARYRLARPWRGWVWLLLAALGLAAAWGLLHLPPLAGTRHQLAAVANGLADRYLRG